MRLLSLFFAFYFALLSCLSCADEAPACQGQPQTTIAAAAHTDCGTHAPGDWCSPLCQCHCCGGVIVPAFSEPALAAAPLPEPPATQRHAQLTVAAPTRGSGAVWQPPQA